MGWVDCDGDGIADPYCDSAAATRERGFLASSLSCASTYGKIAKANYCIGAAAHGGSTVVTNACVQTNGWCAKGGQKYCIVDCDADGVADPFCDDNLGSGSRGFLGSATGCHDNFGKIGYANDCPAAATCAPQANPCARPSDFCQGPGVTFYERDCDNDGVIDPYCDAMASAGERGYLSSANGCKNTYGKISVFNSCAAIPL